MSECALLSREELAEAAFELLTSSSLARYIRLAKTAGNRSSLHDRLRQQPEIIPELLKRVQFLWTSLLSSERREAFEFELAVLLPMLTHTSDPAVDRVLLKLAIADQPIAAWPAALARRLLRERSANLMTTTPGLGNVRPVTVRARNQIALASLSPNFGSHVEVSCRLQQASSQDRVLVEAA